jgi:hypothetical protein
VNRPRFYCTWCHRIDSNDGVLRRQFFDISMDPSRLSTA